MAKRIFVTGEAGFIGAAVVRHIIGDTADEVLDLDKLTYAGNLDSLASVADDPRYAFVGADICDEPKTAEIVSSYRPDVIMHLAAESHVDRSIDRPGAFMVRAWHHTYGLPVLLSSCSNNYGPYHFPEKLIPLIILNGLEGKPLPVYGDGGNVRDWLFVDDHARALRLIAETGGVGESYNVGGFNEQKNIDVVRSIGALLDEFQPDPAIGPREGLITFVRDRPGHDQRYAIDSSKISRELGWTPRETFETGLRKTVSWYLDNRSWWERIRSGVCRGERLGVAS